MNTFEKYINKTENQDLKNFTKYLDAHELAMLEMHFLSFAKEQLRIHDVVGLSEQLKASMENTGLFNAEGEALSIADVCAMFPSSETIEANGVEGGLRDGELQMFWEGATWLKNHLQKQLVLKDN